MDAAEKKAPKIRGADESVLEAPPVGAEPYAGVPAKEADRFARGPAKNIGDESLMRSVPRGTRRRTVLGIGVASIL